MATLGDSYPTSNYNSTLSVGGTSPFRGQAFDLDTGGKLDSVKLYIRKYGPSISGNCEARLYAGTGTLGTDARGTGAVLATSTAQDVTTLPTSLGLVTFQFDGTYDMTAGTDYVIGLYFSGGDASNYIMIGVDTDAPTHEGNSCSFDGSTNWSYSATRDFVFYVYTNEDTAVIKLQKHHRGLNNMTL